MPSWKDVFKNIGKGAQIGIHTAGQLGVPGAAGIDAGIQLLSSHKSEQEIWDGFAAASQGTIQFIEGIDHKDIVDEQAFGAAVYAAQRSEAEAKLAVALMKKALGQQLHAPADTPTAPVEAPKP